MAQAIEAGRLQVKRAPRSAMAWGHLGMVLFAHNFFDEAQVCLAQAENLDSRDPRWPYLQGMATSANADPAKVIPPLERAVERSGTEPVPRLRLGEVFLENGRLDEAESQFRSVLEIDLFNPRANLGMGRVMRGRGNFRASVDHLLRSAAEAPRTRITHALLAELYHRLGDPESADTHRRRMARLPETVLWPDPYLEQVLQREVGGIALLLRVESFLENQEYEFALALLRKTVLIHPNLAPAHFQLWRVHTARGETAAARQALNDAVRLAPDGVQSQYYQGIAMARQGNHLEAAEHFRKVTVLQPQFAAAHCDLGESLYELGRRSEALEAFRASIRYKPNFARGHKNLGRLLAEMGQETDALAHLEQSMELAPPDTATRLLLERLRQRSKASRTP